MTTKTDDTAAGRVEPDKRVSVVPPRPPPASRDEPPLLKPEAGDGSVARVESALLQLSNEVRQKDREFKALKEVVAALPGALPTANPPEPPLDKRFYVPVGLLLTLIGLLLLGLWQIIVQSHEDFGTGVRIARDAYDAGADATAMTRRIFLLASGHQIITFKAAAFVISALMFFVGAVFVLYKAEARYDLQTEGKGLKANLSTSSPGLVIITLAAALAAATLYAKSTISDQPDFDLRPSKEASPVPAPSASVESKKVTPAEEDALDLQIKELLGTSGKSKPPTGERKP